MNIIRSRPPLLLFHRYDLITVRITVCRRPVRLFFAAAAPPRTDHVIFMSVGLTDRDDRKSAAADDKLSRPSNFC